MILIGPSTMPSTTTSSSPVISPLMRVLGPITHVLTGPGGGSGRRGRAEAGAGAGAWVGMVADGLLLRGRGVSAGFWSLAEDSHVSSREERPEAPAWAEIGAGDGIRTRDSELGKLVLYQLSYARSARAERPNG